MATRATIAENLSLPVFSSTQPQEDGGTTEVQFDIPKLQCFQGSTIKPKLQNPTGQRGPADPGISSQAHAAGQTHASASCMQEPVHSLPSRGEGDKKKVGERRYFGLRC